MGARQNPRRARAKVWAASNSQREERDAAAPARLWKRSPALRRPARFLGHPRRGSQPPRPARQALLPRLRRRAPGRALTAGPGRTLAATLRPARSVRGAVVSGRRLATAPCLEAAARAGRPRTPAAGPPPPRRRDPVRPSAPSGGGECRRCGTGWGECQEFYPI